MRPQSRAWCMVISQRVFWMPDGAIWFSDLRKRLKVPVVWSFWWIRAIHPKPVATVAIASCPFRSQIAGLIARAGYRLTEATTPQSTSSTGAGSSVGA